MSWFNPANGLMTAPAQDDLLARAMQSVQEVNRKIREYQRQEQEFEQYLKRAKARDEELDRKLAELLKKYKLDKK